MVVIAKIMIATDRDRDSLRFDLPVRRSTRTRTVSFDTTHVVKGQGLWLWAERHRFTSAAQRRSAARRGAAAVTGARWRRAVRRLVGAVVLWLVGAVARRRDGAVVRWRGGAVARRLGVAARRGTAARRRGAARRGATRHDTTRHDNGQRPTAGGRRRQRQRRSRWTTGQRRTVAAACGLWDVGRMWFLFVLFKKSWILHHRSQDPGPGPPYLLRRFF